MFSCRVSENVCVCMLHLAHMLNERLHYLVAVGHVRDHVLHVVLRGPDQRRSKHQSQVTRLHLESRRGWVLTNQNIQKTKTKSRSKFSHTPCFCLSGRLQFSGVQPEISECESSDLEGLGSAGEKKNRETCLTWSQTSAEPNRPI